MSYVMDRAYNVIYSLVMLVWHKEVELYSAEYLYLSLVFLLKLCQLGEISFPFFRCHIEVCTNTVAVIREADSLHSSFDRRSYHSLTAVLAIAMPTVHMKIS